MLKFKTTTLTDKKTDETNHIREQKMKTFVLSKFLSLNKTQIEKFDHFLINSITVDVSNKKNSHLKVH